MEIYLDKRAVRQIRLSAGDAIEEGDTETLREDIIDSFSDDDIEEIERRIDSGDFYDFVSEILEEWAVEDVDELFELIEAQLSDISIDLKYRAPEDDDDEDDEDDDDDDDDETEVVLEEDDDEV
jgi:hypothetical protein